MILKIDSHFQVHQSSLIQIINNFKTEGTLFGNGKRNTIKLFEIEETSINVKSFKIPHAINKIIYAYFRKSKARRSYEYASVLLEKGIGTPQPIAFFENKNWFGLQDSYYVSEHFETELTYRELIKNPNYPEHEIILRQFTRFSYDLHEKGIEFLDHSPGNTLIKKVADGHYSFYLVDLNRMNFHQRMSFDLRMKNLSKLTPKQDMIAIMSNEYALITGQSEQTIFNKLWKMTTAFQYGFNRKKRIKKYFKFWKS